jgi:hypothetical protein
VLTVVYGALMLIVQRVERKRRIPALIILGIVGAIVARFAIFRIETDCSIVFPLVCSSGWVPQQAIDSAYQTLNLSLLAALVFNVLFWVLIGRSNPPGTSDSIIVIGKDDLIEQ